MKDIKIATSYFYQIRNFKSYMIPVSTALSDPQWYRPGDKEYYIDKRGIVCGLRYKPLIVQSMGHHSCPCKKKELAPACSTMIEYRELLKMVDKDKILKAFDYCGQKFKKELGFEEDPIIVLIVYETPKNKCSERWALQEVFNCKELKYPIKENYR